MDASLIASDWRAMTEPIVIAIIAALGVITTAALGYLGVKRSGDMARITALEQRVEIADKVNNGMWAWVHLTRDHIYRGLGPPPPDPPSWLVALMDK